MRSWSVRAEPAPCRGLVRLAWTGHGLAAVAPWLAGCTPLLALALSAACLLSLPATLVALPGRYCTLRALRFQDGEWSLTLADGRQVAARLDGATRVFEGLLACRFQAGGRRYDWLLPRYAIPATEFRRLKVAMRCNERG
jgi:hypothetical protein